MLSPEIDLTELRKRNGGLFGSGDSTGSVGVVTVNLPRIGYLASNKEQFYNLLDGSNGYCIRESGSQA